MPDRAPIPPPPGLGEWSPLSLARNIVSQLFDLAEVPAEVRQAINDQCDQFVARLVTDWASDLPATLSDDPRPGFLDGMETK